MIDALEYYKNINPLGLSDNYSFAVLSTSVMNCHTSVESRGGSGVNILKFSTSPAQQNREWNDHEPAIVLFDNHIRRLHAWQSK